jgi:ADP-heptose:LPS heptosyltransferase
MDKILLGNTGRGGELCLFTSIIHTYKKRYPNSHITVATNPHYHTLFDNSQDCDNWIGLQYRDPDNKKTYLNPVAAWKQLAKEFDGVAEFACEYSYSPAQTLNKRHATYHNTSLHNCWLRIVNKVFRYEDIPRKVYIYPTDEEKAQAEAIAAKHQDLIIIGYIANSADPVLKPHAFNKLGKKLQKFGTVAYTGRERDAELKGLVDLRGISFGTLYALADHIKWFISPDTSLPFVVSGTPGNILVLRKDKNYPISNTGLQVMGYREAKNTWEIEMERDTAIQTVVDMVKNHA